MNDAQATTRATLTLCECAFSKTLQGRLCRNPWKPGRALHAWYVATQSNVSSCTTAFR